MCEPDHRYRQSLLKGEFSNMQRKSIAQATWRQALDRTDQANRNLKVEFKISSSKPQEWCLCNEMKIDIEYQPV